LRTIRSPTFWNFFLNSDFRSSERLGNCIKFVNLKQIPGFGWSLAHHPIADILEFLPEFRLSLFRATGKLYQVREPEANSRFWLVTCAPSDRRHFQITSLISAFALHEQPES